MASPQQFGKYQILERIAVGGMAEIYKARLEGIGGFQRTFAIKRILPNLSQNSEYIAMLVDEAKVAGLLSHANIVQILDLGEVGGIWYIAMEYVHGRDLGAVLRRAREKGLCLPVPHGVFATIELLKGLEYAHQRQMMRGGRPVALNIIHRDVSPPNILMSFQGEVKLTDFGIARASLKAMETVNGMIKGRFDYMSPEQALGSRDLDQRSDLFSVGIVLYEMLTGHHPFRQDNEFLTIEKVRSGEYIPVSERNPEVPFSLQNIVDRALHRDREKRFSSATAFKEALDSFFHDAGFIFTHATLASYLKGLFPEDQKKKSRLSSRPDSISAVTQSRSHHTMNETYATQPEEEADTRAHDRRTFTNGAGKRTVQELDEPTSLRSNPLSDLLVPASEAKEWESEPLSAKIRPQVWAEDQTLIKPSPYSEEPDDIALVPIGKQQSGGSGGSSVLVGLLTGTGGLFFGVSIGGLLTLAVLFAAGFFSSTQAVGKKYSPRIRVLGPAELEVSLDGREVTKDLVVNADEAHKLQITMPGGETFQTEITLHPGEQRVIVISAPKMEDN